jgi:DNA-binding GntR family transcriptional regulator
MKSPGKGRRNPSLTECALEAIRKRIVEGDLHLGEAVSESALAANLSMSKTPVREALLQLKREGLVDIQPQRGSFVFTMDADQVHQICDFRRALEREALMQSMSLAWGQLVDCQERCVAAMGEAIRADNLATYRHLDAEFHQNLILFCGNTFMIEAYRQIAFRIQALRTRLSVQPENNVRTLAEHERIIEAVIARDPVEAVLRLTDHIEGMRNLYVDTVASAVLPESV